MQDLPALQPGIPDTPYDWSWTIIVGLFLLSAGIVLFIIYHKKGAILKGIRQLWQRFKAPMPDFFRRYFWVGVSLIATYGPVALEKFKLMQLPSWIDPETAENIAFFGSGIVSVAIFAANHRKITPEKFPDLNHTPQPDALISVAPNGKVEVEILKPQT